MITIIASVLLGLVIVSGVAWVAIADSEPWAVWLLRTWTRWARR